MADEVISKDVLINRLKRIEGQVRGLQKMIDNGRDCESILTQLAAVRSAIESVGALVLNNYMRFCFARGSEEESVNIDSLARALAIWGRLHVGDNRSTRQGELTERGAWKSGIDDEEPLTGKSSS